MHRNNFIAPAAASATYQVSQFVILMQPTNPGALKGSESFYSSTHFGSSTMDFYFISLFWALSVSDSLQFRVDLWNQPLFDLSQI